MRDKTEHKYTKYLKDGSFLVIQGKEIKIINLTFYIILHMLILNFIILVNKVFPIYLFHFFIIFE